MLMPDTGQVVSTMPAAERPGLARREEFAKALLWVAVARLRDMTSQLLVRALGKLRNLA
jgi:hypothetical protein